MTRSSDDHQMLRQGSVRRAAGRLLVSLLLLPLCGCAELPRALSSVTEPLGLSTPANEMTESELHSELAEFSARFASVMGSLGERVISDGASAQVRRRALLLRVQLVPLVQQHALDRDPRSGYVALLSLTVMLRLYVTAEDGHLDFGPHQKVVAASVRQLEDELVELGGRFLEPDRLDPLRDEIETFARENRPTRDFTTARVEDSLFEAKSDPRFTRILELPMAPFRALSGVEQGPAAIREFTQTARTFAAIVATLPMQLRWQADLLVYETLRAEAVSDALGALEQTAASAQRLSAASERLPEDLAQALAASEAPLRALDDTLVRVGDLLEPLRSTASEIAHAGNAWADLVDEDDRGDGRDGSDEPDGASAEEPDLEAWQRTAEQIGQAALRLSAAARSIDALLEGGSEHGENMDGRPIDARLRDLVDHIFERIVMLLVVVLALALAYRFLAPRLAARS